MGLNPEHEIHGRRFSRNLGVGAVLGSFVILVFLLTMAKIDDGGTIEGFDYIVPKSQLGVAE